MMFNFIKQLKNRETTVRVDVTVEPSSVRDGREYIVFPDGLRLIVEDGEYVGFYTQNPSV